MLPNATLRRATARQPSATAPRVGLTAEQRVGTRWPFIALCCFILSQAYAIPVLPIGPWPLWPRFSDFAVALLVGASLLQHKQLWAPSPANRAVLLRLGVFYWLCLVSYLAYLLLNRNASAPGVRTGAFQLYMLAIFTTVFFITARIPLDAARIRVLRRVTDVAFAIVVAGVILSAFEIVTLAALTPQLPRDQEVAGPWYRYGFSLAEAGEDRGGWGTISYNHAHVSVQVLLLCGLRLSLTAGAGTLTNYTLLLVATVAAFLTQGRTGFAATLLFAGILWLRRPHLVLAALGAASLLALGALVLLPPETRGRFDTSNLAATADRVDTLADPTNPENLSGRSHIWEERIAFLDAVPTRWLVGTGFGAANDSGDNAHNLPLHLIVELGVLGLAVFTALIGYILWALYHYAHDNHTLFFVTGALIVSCVTQETFYPVAAMGYFPGFYLCVVALTLRPGARQPRDTDAVLHVQHGDMSSNQ